MKKHEPRPTLYNERHPLRLVGEYVVAAMLFVYPVHLINDAITCNLPTRTADNRNLVHIAKAGS